MASRVALASLILLVVAGVVGLAVWWLGDSANAPTSPPEALALRDRAETPRPSPIASPLPAPERAEAEATPPARTPDPLPPPAENRSTGEVAASFVRGRCVDASLRGIEAAQVYREGGDGARTRTDGDGAFLLELKGPPGQEVRCTVRLVADGRALEWRSIRVAAGDTLDLGDVLLRAAGSIEGTVRGPTGLPVAGATLRAEEKPIQAGIASALLSPTQLMPETASTGPHTFLVETTSDDQGRFRLDHVPEGDVRVWAGAEDHRWTASAVIGVVAAGVHRGLELVIEPIGARDVIDLVVLQPDGTPAPRASVSYRYEGEQQSGSGSSRTDADGRYRLFVHVQTTYSFSAEDSESRYRPAVANDVEPGTRDLVLKLGEVRSLQLVVHAVGATEVRGLSVSLDNPANELHLGDQSVDGVVDGPVEVMLPASVFVLRVKAPGFEAQELGPFEPEGMPARLDVTLRALPGVRGTVLAHGRPVAGAEVVLCPAIQPNQRLEVNGFPCRSQAGSAERVTSASDGSFCLTLRDSGSYYIRAEAGGFAPADVGPFELDPERGAEGLRIEVSEGGAIEGRVITPPGETAAGLIVGASRGDGYGSTVRSDAQGQYRFDGLTEGPWQVALRDTEIRPSHRSSSMSSSASEAGIPWSCEVRAGQVTRLDLQLQDFLRSTLSGQFEFPGVDFSSLTVKLSEGDLEVEAAVAADGSFELPAVDPGSYRLVFQGTRADGVFFLALFRTHLDRGPQRWRHRLESAEVELHVDPGWSESLAEFKYRYAEDGCLLQLLLPGRQPARRVLTVPSGPGQIAWTVAGAEEERVELKLAPGEALTIELPLRR